jgi:hypothetical protein
VDEANRPELPYMFCINFFGQQDDKGRVEKTEVSEITSPHSIDSSHDIILDCLPASLVEAPRESIRSGALSFGKCLMVRNTYSSDIGASSMLRSCCRIPKASRSRVQVLSSRVPSSAV